jgi:hypothetical protein
VTDGLTLSALCLRYPGWDPNKLHAALTVEVEAGRVAPDHLGRYRLVPEAFTADQLHGLRTLDRPAPAKHREAHLA